MHNTVILQGVCVSITDPLPREGGKYVAAVLTLDVAKERSGVDTIPVEFRNARARGVKRDILPGDIVTVVGVPNEVGPEDAREIAITGFSAKVQKAVNMGSLMGQIVEMPEKPEMFDGNRIAKVAFRVETYSTYRMRDYIWVETFGKIALEYLRSLRTGMIVTVEYRISTYRRDRKDRLRVLATHVGIMRNKRERDAWDEIEELGREMGEERAEFTQGLAEYLSGATPPNMDSDPAE